MAKYRGVARDEFGNTLSGASVTVYEPDGTTESTIYSDSELTTTQENPITVGDDGVFLFYAVPGYYDIQVAKSVYTTSTLTNEQIGKILALIDMSGAGHNVLDAGATANNCIGNDNWTAVIDSADLPNVFTMDEDTGLITYIGEPTIRCQVLWTQDLYSFAGTAPAEIMMRVAYNWVAPASPPAGGYIASSAASIYTDASDKYNFACMGVVSLSTGDTLHLMLQHAGGTADMYVGTGAFSIMSFD